MKGLSGEFNTGRDNPLLLFAAVASAFQKGIFKDAMPWLRLRKSRQKQEGVPQQEDPKTVMKKRFMNPENLEDIMNMAVEEKNRLKFLLTGVYTEQMSMPFEDALKSMLGEYWELWLMVGSILPRKIISEKHEMEELMEKIKPAFYGITGISPVQDPGIKIGNDNIFVFAYQAMDSAAGCLLRFGPFAAAACLVLGGVIGSEGAQAVSLLSVLGYCQSLQYTADVHALALKNQILIKQGIQVSSSRTMAHEFAHVARRRARLHTGNSFLEEGIATAVSDTIMEILGREEPAYAAYGSLCKINAALESCFGILQNAKPAIPGLEAEFAPDISIADDFLFQYWGGATMIHLAEYRHGREIYKDLFKGDYNCLL